MKRALGSRHVYRLHRWVALTAGLVFAGYFLLPMPAYGVSKNISAANRFAEEIFHKAVLPKDTKLLKIKPGALPNNVPTEAVGNLKDLHAFYLVQMTKPRLLAFVKAHLSKEETITSQGSFYNSSTKKGYTDIIVNVKTGILSDYLSELIYTLAPGPNAYATYLRVDSNTVYLNPRTRQAIVPRNASVKMVLYTKPSLFRQASGKVNIKVLAKYKAGVIKVFNSEPIAPVTVLCMENSLLYNLSFTWGTHQSVAVNADICGRVLYATYDGSKHVNLYESCSLEQNITEVLSEQHLTKYASFLKKFSVCS